MKTWSCANQFAWKDVCALHRWYPISSFKNIQKSTDVGLAVNHTDYSERKSLFLAGCSVGLWRVINDKKQY